MTGRIINNVQSVLSLFLGRVSRAKQHLPNKRTIRRRFLKSNTHHVQNVGGKLAVTYTEKARERS